MFVREIVVKGNVDFLDWWKNKVDSYKKKLVFIVKFFFCIFGMFVFLECVFLDIGNIVMKM